MLLFRKIQIICLKSYESMVQWEGYEPYRRQGNSYLITVGRNNNIKNKKNLDTEHMGEDLKLKEENVCRERKSEW